MLYASLGRVDYVLITSITMVFATMTSYTRARAESLIKKCKVGFMERPERIVLFMIGAFTNRMAAVMWVIGVLSVVTVINRIQYTYLELNGRPQPKREGLGGLFVRAFYWTEERTTVPYDLWVIAILAFVWLTPPDWLGDPMAEGGLGLPAVGHGAVLILAIARYQHTRRAQTRAGSASCRGRSKPSMLRYASAMHGANRWSDACTLRRRGSHHHSIDRSCHRLRNSRAQPTGARAVRVGLPDLPRA